MDNSSISLRDTAKGIAVRASILGIVGLVAGAWLFGLAAKVASGAVKAAVGIVLLAIGGGFAAWEVRKVTKHLTAPQGPTGHLA